MAMLFFSSSADLYTDEATECDLEAPLEGFVTDVPFVECNEVIAPDAS